MTSKPNVVLRISIGGTIVGDVEIKLEDEILPITCSNFRTLISTSSYNASTFHRVIPSFMAQGGDFTNHDGTGGSCSLPTSLGPLGLGPSVPKFKDERFSVVPHSLPGVVSMANSGPDSNGSQFFVTLGPCGHLDKRHVGFGRVVGGMEVMERVGKVDTDEKDRPVVMERKDKKKKKKKSKRSDSSSDSDSDSESSSSSEEEEVLRSSITGKRIKMRIEKTDEDRIKERERDALREFLNG
ncbi:hypothetical protein TrRE_jg1709 [Triparma retinervis]|uniref:Peptidyl-prolyl cis-trans isomerase n=1 Tax=Triparma retinervis TaxID=2557542 RepID=A0A9W6ZFX2_9STRA|nr:hypothetical protein TrRE_jg1709 [Triparma retinervis]